MKNTYLTILLSAGLAFGAVETSHDAPLEIRNNTVHAKFRADTLIDRRLAIAGGFATPEEILQHTHDFARQIRIFIPDQPHMTLNINQGDGLYFRLRGERRFFGLLPGLDLGFLTVTQDETKDGVGGLVASHVALTGRDPVQVDRHGHHDRYGHHDRHGNPNDANAVANQAKNIVTSLSEDDKKSANLVWVTKGPTGYKWVPENQDNDVTIGGKIVTAVDIRKKQSPDVKTIPTAEYLLTSGSNRSNFNIDEFYIVPKGGKPKGHGICLPLGARVVVCENVTTAAGRTVVCPDE